MRVKLRAGSVDLKDPGSSLLEGNTRKQHFKKSKREVSFFGRQQDKKMRKIASNRSQFIDNEVVP